MLTQPYHRRTRPKPQYYVFNTDRIDLTHRHLDPYPKPDPSGVLPDVRPDANQLFDGRAGAAVFAAVGDPAQVRVIPRTFEDGTALLDGISYQDYVSNIYIVNSKCLAAMAYGDYFQSSQYVTYLQSVVSQAIQEASPGWCGSYGPNVSDQGNPKGSGRGKEGNYDFESQMYMLPLVYNFYDDLRSSEVLTKSDVQEKLITKLLALGRMRRPNRDDTITSGGPPSDWYLAGFGGAAGTGIIPIPETENHVLTIATARYLTNQLLYQRFHYTKGSIDPFFDNRRNGSMDQLLGLLRNYLRDDFAEYNAKPYQEETRLALLNLCSYAYDAEVRLGARMVLDYISAHIAVSSNDLRRMVPFRRRNENDSDRVKQIADDPGFMDVNLLQDFHGADPMAAHFALLAGNTRAYQKHDFEGGRLWDWAITGNFGQELTLGALSSYRLPPSIHDLFVNDLHRRFFQRIHRRPLDEPGWQRNCDNMEIYAGSPSYLITAGGKPAPYAIPGINVGPFPVGYDETNKGVAVPISFMPTGLSAANFSSLQELANSVGMSARPISLKAMARKFELPAPFSFRELSKATINTNSASDLIQFLRFSDLYERDDRHYGETENYGVAPDFACGLAFHFPDWANVPHDQNGFFFIDRKSLGDELAGFYLAIIKQNEFVLLEAFDTWIHRETEVSFTQFTTHVRNDNGNIQLSSGKKTEYTTYFGNRIRFVIWRIGEQDNHDFGSKIINIEYGAGDPLKGAVDYVDQSQFLSGNILKSTGDAVTEIHNPSLGTKITLDWSDTLHPHLMRTSEDGEVEHAGRNEAGLLYEVWVDFDWNGPMEGDFYRPFNQLASAVAAVADGGVIKIAPGSTRVRGPILGGKRMKIVAPISGVTIGAP